jgi:small subunit ribosomal protein S16
MALRIRLQRGGSKNNPTYRVVVAEASVRRDGRFVEILGHYSPLARGQSPKMKVDAERADYWLSKGAKPTETVAHILRTCRRMAAVQT